MKNFRSYLIVTLLTLSLPSFAFAIPVLDDKAPYIGKSFEGNIGHEFWVPERATKKDLLGMASLGCSGALVKSNRKPTDKAVLLTNGHCARRKLLDMGEVMKDKPYTRSSIAIGLKDGMKLVTPGNVLYGTMTDTDMALIELEETYEELIEEGARVFEIANHPGTKGEKVLIVSGYWREKQHCEIDYTVHRLKEAVWTWKRAMAFDMGCQVRGGYSGSPVISKTSGKIVAVLNTGNENNLKCSLHNPCEVDKDGNVRVEQGRAYAQEVNVGPCLTKDGVVDLNLADCKLPK